MADRKDDVVTARATGLIYDSRFLDHDTGLALVSATVPADSVWEPQPHAASPNLISRAYSLLNRTGLLSQLVEVPTRPATVEDIERVHTPGHVQHIREVSLAGGGEAGEYAPASRETYDVAMLAAGGALAGVDAVVTGRVRNLYALLRPPGHHATPDKAMGFCYFNNVAVATRYAQHQHGLERVAILDWDVHHGNGTQAAFYDDPSVLFISLHQEDWYPTGEGVVEDVGTGAGAGYTINVPLPAGTGNAGYLTAIERIVSPAIRRFAPDLILVSAGQDPSGVDPLARMAVSADGFRTMAAAMAALADEVCAGRLVACHEGGYSEGYAPVCTWAVVEGLSGIRTPHDDPYGPWLGGMRCAADAGPATAAIDRVIARYGVQWGLN
jgi:acetoin utilization deacetylase AcuC-like enzyme